MATYKYVRIQGKELARNTMTGKGIFSMCWDLIRNDTMDEEDASLFREIDSWFSENLLGLNRVCVRNLLYAGSRSRIRMRC